MNPALERQSQANLYEFGASLVYMLALGKGCIVRVRGGERGQGRRREGREEKEKRKNVFNLRILSQSWSFPRKMERTY